MNFSSGGGKLGFESALISSRTLGKLLNFSPVREGNNANREVNVRARLDNGVANTSSMLKHARSSYREKKPATCLGVIVSYFTGRDAHPRS